MKLGYRKITEQRGYRSSNRNLDLVPILTEIFVRVCLTKVLLLLLQVVP